MRTVILTDWLLIYLTEQMKIKAFLKQAYPIPTQSWLTIAAIGLGVSILMLIMEPFGLSQVQMPNKTLFLAGYGLITFLTLSISLRVLIHLFSEYNWNIQKQVLWSLWIVFSLGISNYVYTINFIAYLYFKLSALLIFQVYSLSIGIIPITILVLIRQNRLLKMNQADVIGLKESLLEKQIGTDPHHELQFFADNGKTHFRLYTDQLAWIESVGNYIHIYYLQNDIIREHVLRSSIAKAQIEIALHPKLIKCHRAFIVNLDFVESIQGNAQGYKLSIKHTDREVHVSRQFTKVLKAALEAKF